MPAKNLLRVSEKGTYLHIYNKGVENRLIFNDDQDYEVFIGYLKGYLTSPTQQTTEKKTFTVKGRTYKGTPHQPKNFYNRVELVGYSLMPNRFHLVLHQMQQGAVERFLRSLSTRYSIYFNKKYQRQGSLFEGPYKSAHIAGSELLLRFVTYLHKKHSSNKYSSAADYSEARPNSIIARDIIVNLFNSTEKSVTGGANSYKNFAENYIFTEKEVNELEKLLLENKTRQLERRDLATTPVTQKDTPLKQQTPFTQNDQLRVPEYLFLAIGFIFLLGIGVRNVNRFSSRAYSNMITNSRILNSQKAPSDSSLQIITRFSEPDALKDESTTASVAASITNSDPANLLYTPIQLKEDSRTTNIYSEATTSSAIHRTAKPGEIFGGAPTGSDWYEVRLDENTFGYIEFEMLKLDQTSNL